MRPALTGALVLLVAPVGLIVVLGGTSSSSTASAASLCTASTPAAAASGSPSPTTDGTTSSAAVGGSLPSLTSEQLSNAAVIARTGATLHIPEPGWVVAIDAALTESDLRNLPSGDADSLGLFRERPSQGWGSPEQVLDPAFAATQFFTHLQAVPHWQTLPVDVAAQDVEQSDHPDRYGPNVAVAQAVLTALTGTVCSTTTTPPAPGSGAGGLRLPGDTVGERAVNAALSQLGVPYSWGGGSLTGPSRGIDQGADTVGFDCSGLARYAYAQAGGPTLPRTSEDQAAIGPHVAVDQLQAGDLLFFHTDGGTASHVGLYDGHGGMIHAPATGRTVTDEPDVLTNPYWSSAFDFATRPAA